jgi:hypothetical protein
MVLIVQIESDASLAERYKPAARAFAWTMVLAAGAIMSSSRFTAGPTNKKPARSGFPDAVFG